MENGAVPIERVDVICPEAERVVTEVFDPVTVRPSWAWTRPVADIVV